ncbi:MAG: TonB family protein [Acidobacteriota bacterium]
MFDKLIESNSTEAEFKNRRSYFMVSTVVVGILFLAAVVASIYAGNIAIGNGDLESADLIAPVETAAMEPERPQPHIQQQTQQSTQTTRNTNMSSVEEPEIVPQTISTSPNTSRSRPNYPFQITTGPETDAGSPQGTGRDLTGTSDTGLVRANTSSETVDPKPDVEKPPALRPPPIKSLGVVNGIATSLPKPAYPAPAVALNVQGKVDVQIMIDETGKVVSAKAASGHPLLKAAAEKAAWSARFKPTLLSNVPVKVTGVIVYNFTKN